MSIESFLLLLTHKDRIDYFSRFEPTLLCTLPDLRPIRWGSCRKWADLVRRSWRAVCVPSCGGAPRALTSHSTLDKFQVIIVYLHSEVTKCHSRVGPSRRLVVFGTNHDDKEPPTPQHAMRKTAEPCHLLGQSTILHVQVYCSGPTNLSYNARRSIAR